MGLIAAAVVLGQIVARYVSDHVLFDGGPYVLKLLLVVLCAIIIWQNQALLKTWVRTIGRTVTGWITK